MFPPNQGTRKPKDEKQDPLELCSVDEVENVLNSLHEWHGGMMV